MSSPIKYCCIISCANNRGTRTDFPFFRFRARGANAEKWIEALKTLYDQPFGNITNGMICALHFKSSDMILNKNNRYSLKPDSVPSVPIQSKTDISADEIKPEKEYNDSMHDVNTKQSNAFTYVNINAIKSRQKTTVGSIDGDGTPTKCIQCITFKLKIEEIQVKCSQLERENKRYRAQIVYYKEKFNLMENIEHDNGIPTELSTICGVSMPKNEIESHPCLNVEESKLNVDHSTPIEIDNLSLVKLFKCGICGLAFEQSKELKVHMKKLHLSQSKDHGRDSALQNAVDFVSSLDKTSRCEKCEEIFATSAEMKMHMKTHQRKRNVYECYICKQTQKNLSTLRLHMRQHSKGKRCLVCDEHVSSIVDRFHLCSEEKSIRCEYCNDSFSAMSTLLQHLEDAHVNRTMHQCRKCPAFFGMELLRNVHEKHHKDIPKSFICDICSKGFAQKYLLKSHITRMHENRETHLCSLCGEQFKFASYLRQHMSKHESKIYQCPKCPLQCRQQQLLKNHSETHLNRKYKCNHCSLEFSTKKNISKHKKLVHSQKPVIKNFQCSFCPYKFDVKDRLRIHLRTHTGEKPFICDMCPDKRYSSKGDLVKHMQNVHGVSYECEVCGQTFRLIKDLKRHSDSHYEQQQQARMDELNV